MDQCTHEVRAEYWKKIIQACGQRLNITVQMYPCSEGTDTGSPAL